MAEEPQFPSHMGRYEVKRLLGAGAMGSVYLAEDPRIKRRVAIKMVKADLLSSQVDRHEILARFQREAEVSGLLNHPGIVTIFDFGESELGAFLAMEYVEGQPLDELLKSGEKLPLQEGLRILLGIGAALDHAHGKGVIHRDVKPGNIMIALDGQPKLMDFGIAKREDASLTQTGTFLGTPSYASPEQIREGIVDNRSDIFSFGVMAFEVLTGKTPFPGSSINTILYKIVNEPPAMPNPPVEGVLPEAWEKSFEKVLAKRPQDRFNSCLDFLHELEMACTGLDAGTKTRRDPRVSVPVPIQAQEPSVLPTIQTQSSTVTPEKSGRSPILVWAGIGLAVLAGAGWVMLRPKNSEAFPPAPSAAAPAPAVDLPPVEPKPVDAAPPVASAPTEPESGGLKVSGAFGVRIKLEGKDLGEFSPGKILELPVGNHQIDLSNPRYFYRESRRVTVAPRKTSPLVLPALASITVDTYPTYGMVTVDGQATQVESRAESTITLTQGRHVFGIQGRSVQFPADIRSDGQQVRFGGVFTQ